MGCPAPAGAPHLLRPLDGAYFVVHPGTYPYPESPRSPYPGGGKNG
jgi:hypothetical protein